MTNISWPQNYLQLPAYDQLVQALRAGAPHQALNDIHQAFLELLRQWRTVALAQQPHAKAPIEATFQVAVALAFLDLIESALDHDT